MSDDGGKNFRRLSERDKHSDNHIIAFKANEPDYFLEYFTMIMSVVIMSLLGIHSYFDAKAKKKGSPTGVCV